MQTISTNSSVRRRCRPAAHRRGGAQTKTQVCSANNAGYVFLRHRFGPVWNSDPLPPDAKTMQERFHASLTHLAQLYSITVPRSGKKPFPFSIYNAYETVAKKLEKKYPELTVLITHDDQHYPCICTAEFYYTDPLLYYIPVKPLCKLWKDKKRRQAAELLTSVFAYLYQILQVPFYSDDHTFLHDCYHAVKDWIAQEEEEFQTGAQELKMFPQLFWQGRYVNRKIAHPRNLQQFSQRLKQFTVRQPMDEQIRQMAKLAFDLYTKFPDMTLNNLIPDRLIHPEYEERISAEQYIAFFWDATGDHIYDSLMEYVNGCFEIAEIMEPPVAYQRFDRPHQKAIHDHTFAAAFFELLEQLNVTLMKLP